MDNKWTIERCDRLVELWGKFAPSTIGDTMQGAKFKTAEINAKAKELGLPAYIPKKRGAMSSKNKLKVRELDDGMIELAPGNVCSKESYALILKAMSAPCSGTENSYSG